MAQLHATIVFEYRSTMWKKWWKKIHYYMASDLL